MNYYIRLSILVVALIVISTLAKNPELAARLKDLTTTVAPSMSSDEVPDLKVVGLVIFLYLPLSTMVGLVIVDLVGGSLLIMFEASVDFSVDV